jgi:hypothetical protein
MPRPRDSTSKTFPDNTYDFANWSPRLRLPRFLLLRLSGYVINSNNASHYSLWGSNPRPMAHKTIALITKLREHSRNTCIGHSGHSGHSGPEQRQRNPLPRLRVQCCDSVAGSCVPPDECAAGNQ